MGHYLSDAESKAQSDELTRLRAREAVLLEALKAVTAQWPAAFDALAPSFRHMTSGNQVATVNNFDQAVIRGSKALATLDVEEKM